MEPTWLDTLPEETRNAIPEEYRGDPNVTKYKDIGEFFKGHKNLVETVGKKGVIVPGEKADPKEWEPVYNALGRPEKPEGYKITMPEKLHASIKPTPESQAEFHKIAHSLGLSNKSADGLNAWYLQKLSMAMTAQDEVTASNRKTASELRGQVEKMIVASHDRNPRVTAIVNPSRRDRTNIAIRVEEQPDAEIMKDIIRNGAEYEQQDAEQ